MQSKYNKSVNNVSHNYRTLGNYRSSEFSQGNGKFQIPNHRPMSHSTLTHDNSGGGNQYFSMKNAYPDECGSRGYTSSKC